MRVLCLILKLIVGGMVVTTGFVALVVAAAVRDDRRNDKRKPRQTPKPAETEQAHFDKWEDE